MPHEKYVYSDGDKPASIIINDKETYSDMSLRDWFAGMALQGLIANCWSEAPDTPYSRFAFTAYQMADCMLNERNGNG